MNVLWAANASHWQVIKDRRGLVVGLSGLNRDFRISENLSRRRWRAPKQDKLLQCNGSS